MKKFCSLKNQDKPPHQRIINPKKLNRPCGNAHVDINQIGVGMANHMKVALKQADKLAGGLKRKEKARAVHKWAQAMKAVLNAVK